MRDGSGGRGFVGRGAELGAFEQAVASARQDTPSVLLVTGEAGIGKTSTIREGAARAGLTLRAGRCVPLGGQSMPLSPLADLLRQVDRGSGGALREREEFTPLARWMESDPRARAETGADLFGAVLELVAHLADAEVAVLGFEDLHWADTVTLDLFEFLARNLVDERVVLIGTYRTDDVAADALRRRLASLPRLPSTTRLHLQGLEPSEVKACVAGLLDGSASEELVDAIIARSQGNPFFTEELVAAHVAGQAIPVVLSDLIAAEVATLDEWAGQVLATVAAIGRETDHDLLRDATGLEDRVLEPAVRSCLDAHLLVVDHETAEYRFRHALIGEVVYADLLPPERTRLHCQIAAALRLQAADALTRADRAGELAFHLDRGGAPDAAFAALLIAADAAAGVAPAVALAQLERALELWDEEGSALGDAERARRLWQAAELAAGAVGNARSVVLARAALEIGPPPEGEARGHERLARYLWGAGELVASRVELERAVALLPGADAAESAPVYAGLGQAELMAGNYEAAERWCVQALEVLGTPEADATSWVMARRVQGVVRSCLGDPEGGVVVCREAWRSAPAALDRALAALYYCVALLDAGRHEECVAVALDAVAQARRSGLDASYGGYSDALAAEALVRLGRWTAAEDRLARHADHPGGLPVGVLRVARAEALLAARRGEADRARVLLDVAASQPVDGWHQAVLDATVAEVHLILGDWADALGSAERGMAGIGSEAALWTARFATIAIEAEVEQALDALAVQRPLDRDGLVERLRGRLDEVQAAPATRSGPRPALDIAARLAQAGASLTRLTSPDPGAWALAADRWRELGDTWWVTVAKLRQAEAAASTGEADVAAAALQDAHLLASTLGAAPLTAEVEAVSRRTRLSVEAPERVVLDAPSIEHLGLTHREAEVLVLLSDGRTNRQIGAELFISEKTASVHVSNILRKLGVSTRVDAAAVARRLGLPED